MRLLPMTVSVALPDKQVPPLRSVMTCWSPRNVIVTPEDTSAVRSALRNLPIGREHRSVGTLQLR